jgi:hypothetical protein
MKEMNKIFKMAQTIHRTRIVEEGFYDGRFRSRVMDNKKKSKYLKLRKNKLIEF